MYFEQVILQNGKFCVRKRPRIPPQRDAEWLSFEYVCKYCPIFGDERRFKRKAELVRHVSLHFPDKARPFKCSFNYCNYSASRREYLRSHYRAKHGGLMIQDNQLVRIEAPEVEEKKCKLPKIVMSYYRDFPKMFQNLKVSGKTSARQKLPPKNLFESSKISLCRLSRLLSS